MHSLLTLPLGAPGPSLEPDFVWLEELEELLPWEHSSPAHLYHWWARGDPWEKSPTYFNKAGKSPRTHRWRGVLGNVPASLKWQLEVTMTTRFLAHQAMKEGEACRRAARASAALGSHPHSVGRVLLRSEASLGTQPFLVVSGRTTWVLVLFHERIVFMEQEDKNMNKESKVTLNSDFVIRRHLICMCST